MFEPIIKQFNVIANRQQIKKTLDKSHLLYLLRKELENLHPEFHEDIKLASIKNNTLNIEVKHPILSVKILEKKAKLIDLCNKISDKLKVNDVKIRITY